MLIEKISEAIVAVGCAPLDRVRVVIHELARSVQNGVSAAAGNDDNHLPVLNIFILEGRSKHMKQTLSDKLAMTLVEAGYGPDRVRVSIQEISSAAWGIGGKTARDLGR